MIVRAKKLILTSNLVKHKAARLPTNCTRINKHTQTTRIRYFWNFFIEIENILKVFETFSSELMNIWSSHVFKIKEKKLLRI